ncbi:MAG: DUF2264 domain-containing protein [Butyrivibrio sp.]|nr:DUF2264 domain-containing protein [Acetatifactor muris]MCM1558607.1 DUF2264 domain-containing protein [Butyrivibrio sp.]
MKFEPKTLDYDLSPYTGLTRESWLEAGKYMLEGIFRHIDDFQKPVVMPRQETEITYPHLRDSEEAQHTQRLAEIFEGLTRSFFIAAPMIQNLPDLQICGYSMADYYKNQVLRCCTPGDALYIGTYEDQQEITGHADPFRAFQQTVETCALVICLWVSRAQIWDTYTKEEKDIIADFLESYAHENTVPQNWRLFNMLDMAFLHMEGYPIRKDVMLDHAQAVLNYYAGDGWYRDGHSFDYYSCWAFNVYAPIWNLWYGYENAPWLAKQFEEHSNRLMETYGDFFDRDGWTNMWGRSNIYRNAATSAFDGNMLLRDNKGDPGLARRISSGSLMQFLGREDFLWEGIPTLGFYGQFSPLVQGYSCAESPFWLGKAFLCLHLPADHPFWTAVENNGSWERLRKNQVKVTTLDGPALCFSNHEASGETILRTGKVVKNVGDIHGMWNYSKLCYNTKYPWESFPRESTPRQSGSGTAGAVCPAEAQQYVLLDSTTGKVSRANVTFWHGEEKGVLYRRQFFDYRLDTECHWIQAVNLADFAVPLGILRADKLRLHRCPVKLTLGSYGFPDNGTEVIEETRPYGKAVILKGRDFRGCEKQMAMTIYYDGWKDLKLIRSTGTNPDSEKSIVLYAETERKKQYGYEPYILISQVLTKQSHQDFTEEELFPVEELVYTDPERRGGYGPVILRLKDGTEKHILFEGIEGKLLL